jgi:SAM-dependent methyltransferase
MTRGRFPDHFSGHAELYARARPTYPSALYDFLVDLAPATERCWDCATGNGQAALALAERFDKVFATDASPEQLEHAPARANVVFRQALAEASGLEAGSIDLVTVAAAAHWFDHDAFHAEVRRVARPRGVVALWTYGTRVVVSDAVDAIVDRLAHEVLAPHWPEQFRHVRSGYRTLPFPFAEVDTPELAATTSWTLAGFLDNLRSWSGSRAYMASEGHDPVDVVLQELNDAWGADDTVREVRFPLSLRVGRV